MVVMWLETPSWSRTHRSGPNDFRTVPSSTDLGRERLPSGAHGATVQPMPTSRTYGEACGIPRALDRVGERWALMIVRELVLGPKRFTDIREGLPGLSPDVLSQRLRELEEAAIVQRRELPPPAASKVYELTDWGRELEDVLI